MPEDKPSLEGLFKFLAEKAGNREEDKPEFKNTCIMDDADIRLFNDMNDEKNNGLAILKQLEASTELLEAKKRLFYSTIELKYGIVGKHVQIDADTQYIQTADKE